MWPNPQFPADLVTFSREIWMENFIFVQCILHITICSKSRTSLRNIFRIPNTSFMESNNINDAVTTGEIQETSKL